VLPADGPATLEGTKVHAGIDPTDVRDDARIAAIVRAVNGVVRSLPHPIANVGDSIGDGTGDPAWAPFTIEGANLLAARVWKRKGQPGGVEAISGSAAYVMRNDPDVAMFLGLDGWSAPAVG